MYVFGNLFKILKHFHSKSSRFHSSFPSVELMSNSFLLSILLLTHLFFCGSRFKDYELGVITRCQALCHYCGDKNGLNRLAMEGSFQKKTPLLWYTIVVCCYRVSKTFFRWEKWIWICSFFGNRIPALYFCLHTSNISSSTQSFSVLTSPNTKSVLSIERAILICCIWLSF